MRDGVLKISQSHNSILGTVHLCRDEYQIKLNMLEKRRNRTRQLTLMIDYHEGKDEEGFVVSRKLDTVNFIFAPEGHPRKFNYDRHSFVGQFVNSDKAKGMFSDTFPNSQQDVVASVFNSLKHFIVGFCDRNKILM